MNSTRTGPIDGALPPAANRQTGVSRTTARRESLLKFLVKNDNGSLFIYQVLEQLLLII
jgi:hypothetical protein